MNIYSIQNNNYAITNSKRITGLNSGLETDKIIQDLMRAEKKPLEKLEKKSQILEWKKETYGDVIDKLNQLKNSISGPGGILNTKKMKGETSDSSVASISGNSEVTLSFRVASLAKDGAKAEIVLSDGQSIKSDTNIIEYNGAKINIFKPSEKTIEANLRVNTEGISTAIHSFISSYNEVLKTVNEKTNERNKGYAPLTKEQREEMKEKEIEKWESEAKKGIVFNDPILKKLANEVRSSVFQGLKQLELNKLGITSSNYSDRGAIQIDQDKLKNALAENPDSFDLVFKEIDGTNGEKGIARKSQDTVDQYIRIAKGYDGKRGILIEKAGIDGLSKTDYFSKQIEKAQQDYIKLQEKFNKKQEDLYKKYTALEQAMARMNIQFMDIQT